jgi:hypothetical protein
LIHFLLFEAHGVVFMPLEQGGEVGEAAERFAGRASDFEVGRVGFRVGIAESRIDVGGKVSSPKDTGQTCSRLQVVSGGG